jgi:hypothetical protein
MLVLEFSSVERIAWKSLVLSAAAGLSCGIGAGSGLKAREHASCKRQVELVRGTCVTVGTKTTCLGESEWCFA